jgi:CHAD domain-containing protein
VDTYYDTPRRTLLSSGSSFRVRTGVGLRPEATAKFALPSPSTLVLARREVSQGIGDGARVGGLGPGPLRAMLRRRVGEESLEVLATLRSARTAWTVRGPARVRAEASIDRVVASASGARRRFVEGEVERKAGRARDFVAWVTETARRHGLAPGGGSKLATILSAAGIAVPTAGEVALALAVPRRAPGPGTRAGAAMGHALARGALRLARAVSRAKTGTDPEAVHDLRTTSRRLRAVLRLVEGDRTERRALRGLLRRLADRARPVRDTQVLLDALPVSTGPADALGNAALARAVAEGVLPAHGRLLGFLDREAPSLLARLTSLAKEAARTDPVPFVVAGAARLPGDLERALRDRARLRGTGAAEAPAHLHALRLSLKRARYAAEVFAPAFGRPLRAFLAAASRLQDDLGAVQDADALREPLRRALARVPRRSPVRRAARGARDRAVASLERASAEARARLPRRIDAALGPRALRRLGAHLGDRAGRAGESE